MKMRKGASWTVIILVLIAGLLIGIGADDFSGKSVSKLEDKVQSLENKVKDLKKADKTGTTVIAEQDPGKTFYWVLPAKRKLSRHVFGTPANPIMANATFQIRLQQAEKLPNPLGKNVKKLLKKLPFLVSVPTNLRETNKAGTEYTQTTKKLPFGHKKAKVTKGSFRFVYRDIQRRDGSIKPAKTADEVEVKAQFKDPAGNNYTVKVKKVIKPPIPGWQTGGGVITNTFHHGITETGPPLFPQVYTWGAAWSMGNVYMNGELINKNQLVHFMTTEAARNKQYRLVGDKELPLPKEETIAGQNHHSHMMIMPFKVTKKGPKFEPVHTGFTLPNGKKQPFIHAMWEQDTIVKSPFGNYFNIPE
ncbi:MAG: hypothetical protein SVV03_06120 [Candidatus Nanohaloarchaea archaeon]|nr:hypothetical protein [Candidatus Nanohaloarchaea archaeon]